MCVAVPGIVKKIKDQSATVEIMGNQCEANISLVSVKEGDYVLMHAGCVIEVLKRDTAMDILNLFEELREVSDEK